MKHPLLLGIDASRSTHAHPTGVERYSTEVLEALLEEVTQRRMAGFEIRLYTPRIIPHFSQKLQRVLWFPRMWSLVRLSWEMLWHRPDLLFVPAHVLPFFAPRRSFVTIHDIAFRKIPRAYGAWQAYYLNWSTARALRRCERIFVPSEAVRHDLVQFYGKQYRRKIIVIPHGPLPMKAVKIARSDTPLFFFLGRLEAKKNLSTLIAAWKIVQKKLPEARLTLAGSWGPQTHPLLSQAEGLNIDFCGFVNEQRAAELFHSATAFVFPSLEEGFGLPLIQAFSADCPVLCSNIPALREVGGDAALYCAPSDVTGFADAMLTLASDSKLRERLTVKGRSRLQRFSWKKAAQVMMDIFYMNPRSSMTSASKEERGVFE